MWWNHAKNGMKKSQMCSARSIEHFQRSRLSIMHLRGLQRYNCFSFKNTLEVK